MSAPVHPARGEILDGLVGELVSVNEGDDVGEVGWGKSKEVDRRIPWDELFRWDMW